MAKEKNQSVRSQGLPDGDAFAKSPVKGSIGSNVIGPRSATRAVDGGSSLNRGAKVAKGNGGKYNHLGTAPYHEKGYEGSKTKDEIRKPF